MTEEKITQEDLEFFYRFQRAEYLLEQHLQQRRLQVRQQCLEYLKNHFFENIQQKPSEKEKQIVYTFIEKHLQPNVVLDIFREKLVYVIHLLLPSVPFEKSPTKILYECDLKTEEIVDVERFQEHHWPHICQHLQNIIKDIQTTLESSSDVSSRPWWKRWLWFWK